MIPGTLDEDKKLDASVETQNRLEQSFGEYIARKKVWTDRGLGA